LTLLATFATHRYCSGIDDLLRTVAVAKQFK